MCLPTISSQLFSLTKLLRQYIGSYKINTNGLKKHCIIITTTLTSAISTRLLEPNARTDRRHMHTQIIRPARHTYIFFPPTAHSTLFLTTATLGGRGAVGSVHAGPTPRLGRPGVAEQGRILQYLLHNLVEDLGDTLLGLRRGLHKEHASGPGPFLRGFSSDQPWLINLISHE